MIYQIKRAKAYLARGETLRRKLNDGLAVDSRFILSLLIALYKKTLDKIESVDYNVFNGEHELSALEVFQTTFRITRLQSYGKVRTIGLGLSLLYKAMKNLMN